MSQPQDGLFHEGVADHHYLEFSVKADAADSAVKTALAAVHALIPKRDRTLFLAFGKALWARLSSQTPGDLMDHPDYVGGGFTAPGTQTDIWVWLQGPGAEGNLKLAREIAKALAPVADLAREIQGMKTEGNRDLIGFVDGTGNPKTWEAKADAVLIKDGDGGTFVMAQVWHHDLDKFQARPLAEQEGIVGRTKWEDIELEGDDMPANSHVSRTDVSVDGVAQKIYRRSAAFGTTQAHGLYFIGFGCEIARFDIQMRRMYGMTDDGITDRMIEFSTPVSGSYYYAPGRDELARALS